VFSNADARHGHSWNHGGHPKKDTQILNKEFRFNTQFVYFSNHGVPTIGIARFAEVFQKGVNKQMAKLYIQRHARPHTTTWIRTPRNTKTRTHTKARRLAHAQTHPQATHTHTQTDLYTHPPCDGLRLGAARAARQVVIWRAAHSVRCRQHTPHGSTLACVVDGTHQNP